MNYCNLFDEIKRMSLDRLSQSAKRGNRPNIIMPNISEMENLNTFDIVRNFRPN